jgi:hypothetical protein
METKVGCHGKKRSINSHVHKTVEPANGLHRKVYMVVTNYKLKTKRKCPQPIPSVSSKKKEELLIIVGTAFLSHMDTDLCFYHYCQYLVYTS